MDDLIVFLRAQLDKDASVARAAKSGPWHVDGGSVYATHPTDEVVDYSESADHIARHDPARVLREVEAKRQLLALYEEHERLDRETFEAEGQHARSLSSLRAAYFDAVRFHAAVYADHPGYRPEWAPSA